MTTSFWRDARSLLNTLLLLIGGGFAPAGSLLTYTGAAGPSGDFFSGPFDLALSPDGKHVYAVATLGDSLVAFSRDALTGQLAVLQSIVDDDSGGTVPGLDAPRGVAVSPDGKHVYVASLLDAAVVLFSRESNSLSANFGKLTFEHAISDGAGAQSIRGAHDVTVSRDGKHLYVAARSSNAVASFARDPSNGRLTWLQSLVNGVGGVTGMTQAERLALSPDDKHLYIAAESGSLAVFSRNTSSESANFGRLTFVESHHDDVGGADGLAMPTGVAVSPDGAHVYSCNAVGPDSDDWIGIFARNPTSGTLTFLSKLSGETVPSCDVGIDSDNEIALSPDGERVVAAQSWSGAAVVLDRNPATGSLTVSDWECDDLATLDLGIFTINAVAISPDGKHAYSTGLGPPNLVSSFTLSDDNFADWMAALYPGATDTGFDEDADRNGVPNGIAYALGESYRLRPSFGFDTFSLAAPRSRIPPDVTLSIERTPFANRPEWDDILRYENGEQSFIAPGVSVSFGSISDPVPPAGAALYRFVATHSP